VNNTWSIFNIINITHLDHTWLRSANKQAIDNTHFYTLHAQNNTMAPKKVLIVLTSHDKLGDTGKPTGWYLVCSHHS